MSNVPYSRTRSLYITDVSAFGTAVAPANGDACRLSTFEVSPEQPINIRPDVNPSLSRTAGTPGRKSHNWRCAMSLAGSGTAGTPPDAHLLWRALFGKYTNTPGTSDAYECDDVQKFVDLYHYVKGSPSVGNVSQEAALSAVVSQAVVEFGGDFATVEFSGESKVNLTTEAFSGSDTDSKCGLASFPTEPGSPTTSGDACPGYKGTVTIDGNPYTTTKTGRLTIASPKPLIHDNWGSDLPAEGAPDIRDVTFDFTVYDDDGNILTVKAKAWANTAIDVSFGLGTAAGNIHTFLLKNVLMGKPKYDYSQTRRAVTFTGCRAHATSGTSKDEAKYTVT